MRDSNDAITMQTPATDTGAGDRAPTATQPLGQQFAQVVSRLTDCAKANPAATLLVAGGLVAATVIILKPKAKSAAFDVRAERELSRMLAEGRRSSSHFAESMADRLTALVSTAMANSPEQLAALKARGEAWLHDNGYLKR